MDASSASLVLQLLEWVRERPRTYAETMDAWKSHCPRFTPWEDAVADGLLRLEAGGSRVSLTEEGEALLER